MEWDENSLAFGLSFDYGGESFQSLLPGAQTARGGTGGETTVEIRLGNLKLTRVIKRYPAFDAVEWVHWFENTGEEPTGVISALFDCDVRVPFENDEPRVPGYRVKETSSRVYSAKGSVLARDEFCPKAAYLAPGQTLRYACEGGRSSNGTAPFFNVCRERKGIYVAVGWSGQWQAYFTRGDGFIGIRTGIENTGFRLLPGEKIRTSSVLLMGYEGDQPQGRNRFRRLVREHFSLIGKPGKPENGPFCTMVWGALPTAGVIERLEKYKQERFGFEYLWMDAAWYGSPSGYCPSEHVGDWGTQTGNWAVNTKTHPDGLLDVAAKVKENGMKFLLWIEPERVIASNPTPREHPGWYFKRRGDDRENATWLLNLGDEGAFEGTAAMVEHYIETLSLGCYRQDFNTDPLPYWLDNDEPERAGICEIKHIMGLYRLWDRLLEKYPSLIIDNCASGGRRIDIETLRRSIPLWRSDYQCTWDFDPETSQTHNMGFSSWLPFTGTGTGKLFGDDYRFRSSYAAALTTSYWGYEGWEISDGQPLEWVRRSNAEYLRARPYFSRDFYALTPPPMDDCSWAASQYHDPDKNAGIVLAFRRPLCPCDSAVLRLEGLDGAAAYRVEDAGSGEAFETDGASLAAGLRVCLPCPRSSKLYFYSKITAE
ncbi:MAG TPA: alpha-galactosidase [Clostridiales bacterium]|nr:MAG: Alpha-galactosidase [Firmicutes bacterium ADurb.Bin262]HQK72642.1 alpha-galactosidase [Clostridiales bacterium]